MCEQISTKLSAEGLEFFKRFRNNRRKVGTDSEDLPYWKLLEVIEKYFKLNNEAYLELVRTKGKW